MAHKTLVDGTAYDITGGMTLVEGTSYSIKNGKTLIDGTEYDITFLLPPGALNLWEGSYIYNTINCIIYANGYWVVGGCYRSGTAGYARIAYATSLDGPWTTKDIWSASTNANYEAINCIAYANGYWVVGGIHYASSSYYAQTAYSTSLDGTWSTKSLWSSNNSYLELNCITYADGYWAVGGRRYSNRNYSAIVAYTTNLSGSWSQKEIWWSSDTNNTIECITYANGYWVVGGCYMTHSNYYARIAYATSPGGSWSSKNLWNKNYLPNTINCITYADGYWVVGGVYYDATTSYARIAYATIPNGSWTTKDIWSYATERYNAINCIAYANGYWVVGGTNKDSREFAALAYSTSLDGTWSRRDMWGASTDSKNALYCGIYANGYWAFGGRLYDGSRNIARILYAGNPSQLGTTG